VDLALLGLNVAQMRALAATCQREANQIRATVHSLQRTVDATWWEGPDADAFREQWVADHRRAALDAANDLDALASYLSRQISNQEVTSSR
jgi:uncharacterized protein YukE